MDFFREIVSKIDFIFIDDTIAGIIYRIVILLTKNIIDDKSNEMLKIFIFQSVGLYPSNSTNKERNHDQKATHKYCNVV